jgi:hypothetical protein
MMVYYDLNNDFRSLSNIQYKNTQRFEGRPFLPLQVYVMEAATLLVPKEQASLVPWTLH